MSKQTLAVILVHGFLDAGEIWRPVMNIIGAAASEWIAPDLPGMGKLWKDEGPFSLYRYADFIAASIDKVGGPMILVGHSMGAQIVEIAALRRAESVRGLFLLSPVPLGGAHAPDPAADALAATGGDVDAQRAARRNSMAKPVDEVVLERLTEFGRNVRRDATQKLVAAFNTGVPEGRGRSDFEGPVLVASGTGDTFVTPQMAIDVAARFKSSSRVELKNCGHWPHAEHPELVAETLSKFIASFLEKAAAGKGADG